MTRPLRNVLVGVPYHLTQRGKYRQQVFFNDDDYTHSLELLWHYARKYGLEILAYCLMPNHVHYVAIPHTEFAFARTFGIGHMCYARYRHQPLHRSGHLWQGRFFAAPLDEEYCSRAVRYVELNPLRAHLVDHPEAWLWSSAAIHLRGERLPGTAYPPDIALQSWREYLGQDETPGVLDLLRTATHNGRPCGDTTFLTSLEQRFQKSFTTKPRGRPKKIIGINNV